MNIEAFRMHCLSKKGVTEEFPFDNVTLVYKVMGKMFAATDIDLFTSINLKCDPEKAIELREHFSSILPGYHMNKKHWNTILIDGSISNKLIFEMVDESYNLVVAGLTKKEKNSLINLS
jgi:predicted DNA-binding protein (MmcQ/YjbR family)